MEKKNTKKSIFKDQNPKDIFDIVRSADLKFVFIAIRIYDFVFCL